MQSFAINTVAVNTNSCYQKSYQKEIGVKKEPTCCKLMNVQQEDSSENSKKDCCSGDKLLSCCVYVIAIIDQQTEIFFQNITDAEKLYGYIEPQSTFSSEIFRPPIV